MSESGESNGERETNEAAARASDERAARLRVPGSFDLAFLSDTEGVTELLLIRHGQQEYDVNGPVSELLDPPLSELGRTQARLVGMALSTERIDHVYASPLQRALNTGQEIARHHRLEPVVVEDLREVGIFAEMPRDRTPLEFIGRLALQGARERMITEKSWDVYPYSESSAAFRKRVVNAIEGIIASHPGERIAIACHGGVINCVRRARHRLAVRHVLPPGAHLDQRRGGGRRAAGAVPAERRPSPDDGGRQPR